MSNSSPSPEHRALREVLDFLASDQDLRGSSEKQQQILRLIESGHLNEEALIVSKLLAGTEVLGTREAVPRLTSTGLMLIQQGWWDRLTGSQFYRFLRDVAAFVGILVAIWVAFRG